MCTATVYKLVARDELAEVRVLNAVRVRQEDLDAFASRQTRRNDRVRFLTDLKSRGIADVFFVSLRLPDRGCRK